MGLEKLAFGDATRSLWGAAARHLSAAQRPFVAPIAIELQPRDFAQRRKTFPGRPGAFRPQARVISSRPFRLHLARFATVPVRTTSEATLMTRLGEKLLLVYSAVATAALAIALLTGAGSRKPQVFDEIDVHRINVVEPDGTLRMVISNKARLPGVIVKGKEQPPSDRPQAGLLFYNDEGSENGGLIFGGRKNADGQVVDSGGSLSFDKYGANQIVQLAGVDDSTDKFAGLAVSDDKRRVWVGRTADGAASLSLMDAAGRKRIVMIAPASGTPRLELYDEKGNIVQKLVPEAK